MIDGYMHPENTSFLFSLLHFVLHVSRCVVSIISISNNVISDSALNRMRYCITIPSPLTLRIACFNSGSSQLYSRFLSKVPSVLCFIGGQRPCCVMAASSIYDLVKRYDSHPINLTKGE